MSELYYSFPAVVVGRSAWFPVHIKPVRVGVYERSYNFGIRFAYWDGTRWGGFASTTCYAYANRDMITGHQDAAWRGLDAQYTMELRRVS